MAAAYQQAIERAALAIATAKPELWPRVIDSMRQAMQLRDGIVGDMVERSAARAVIEDVLTRVLQLYEDKLVPQLRTEFSAELADAVAADLGATLREALAEIEVDFGSRH